jgi:acyl carrier protein
MNPDVLTAVRECLANALALGAGEITSRSRLIDDLGADSLDFLDILFSLERRFSLKLRGLELDSLLRADFSEDKLVEGRYVAREEIERMAQWLPALAEVSDRDQVTPRMLYSCITVESLVILVERRIAER